MSVKKQFAVYYFSRKSFLLEFICFGCFVYSFNCSILVQLFFLLADLPTYLTRFQWDIAKYPIKQSLRNIADIISKQVGQIDADLKTKSTAYNNLKGNLQNLEKKQT